MRRLIQTLVLSVILVAPTNAYGEDPSQLAPFTAVRWESESALVQVDGEWFTLHSIDGVSTEDILAFCKKTYASLWQKRFGEDLVQVLTEMGNEPGDTVDLVLKPVSGGDKIEKKGVPMTSANRRSVLTSNRAGRSPASVPRNTAPTKRVKREHATEIAAEWEGLFAPSWLGEDRDDWDSPMMSREQAEEDLDQLEWLLEDRYSYLEMKGVDYRAALDAIRVGTRDGIRTNAFAIQLMKFLALIGDGHTRLTDSSSRIFPTGNTSFLIDEAEGGLACFDGRRTGFLDKDYPYIEAINGIGIEDWIAASSLVSSGYSAQFARREAIRNLRYLGWVAMEMGEELGDEITITLTDGESSTNLELPVTSRRAAYGEWPRTETKKLDGNVGYIRMPGMESDRAFLDGLRGAMKDFEKTDALIIDVRGNGGGSRAALLTLFPYLMKKSDAPQVVNVGRYKLREGDSRGLARGYLDNRALFPKTWSEWGRAEKESIDNFAKRFKPEWKVPKSDFSDGHYMVISPVDSLDHYTKPVKILINADCFSATDIFVSAFKGWRNVELIGTATGGGSGRSQGVNLARSGLSLRMSSMASFQQTGALYDGNGVEPDVVMKPIGTDFLGETDTVLERTLERIAKGD